MKRGYHIHVCHYCGIERTIGCRKHGETDQRCQTHNHGAGYGSIPYITSTVVLSDLMQMYVIKIPGAPILVFHSIVLGMVLTVMVIVVVRMFVKMIAILVYMRCVAGRQTVSMGVRLAFMMQTCQDDNKDTSDPAVIPPLVSMECIKRLSVPQWL